MQNAIFQLLAKDVFGSGVLRGEREIGALQRDRARRSRKTSNDGLASDATPSLYAEQKSRSMAATHTIVSPSFPVIFCRVGDAKPSLEVFRLRLRLVKLASTTLKMTPFFDRKRAATWRQKPPFLSAIQD